MSRFPGFITHVSLWVRIQLRRSSCEASFFIKRDKNLQIKRSEVMNKTQCFGKATIIRGKYVSPLLAGKAMMLSSDDSSIARFFQSSHKAHHFSLPLKIHFGIFVSFFAMNSKNFRFIRDSR